MAFAASAVCQLISIAPPHARDSCAAARVRTRVTGEGALTAANRLRRAAQAAYAFSLAFRAAASSMISPCRRWGRWHGTGGRTARFTTNVWLKHAERR